MRLLHTADWHVGKTLARRSRLDEAERVLRELVEIADREDVDVVLVCGDLFEHQAPSPDAERVVYETLLRLESLQIRVALIPGNHDHPDRWRALEPLLQRCSVHVIPEVRRPDRGGILALKGRNGTVLEVAALPWVHERKIGGVCDLMAPEEQPFQNYADGMGRLLTALCKPLCPDRCHILAAHLFVSGSRIGGGERPLTIGEIYAITAQAIPMVQYAALGHVHRPQRVAGAAVPAQYSGSLLQLDFGEVEQDKSVAIVDLEPGRPAQVRTVPINAGRRLRDVAGTLDELEQYRATEEEEWLRVLLRCDRPQPGLGDSVREILPHALEVRLDYPREDGSTPGPTARLSPRELFAAYYHDRHTVPADNAMLDLFEQILDEVSVA